MTAETPKLWTVREAAPVLNTNYKSLYKHLKANGGRVNGVLVGFQIMSSWKLIPDAVRRAASDYEATQE